MISIFALIYRSTVWADSVMASLDEATPELHDGTAEFFFIANNASIEVRRHLVKKHYPHYVRREPLGEVPDDIHRSEKFDYLIDVYRGWNAGIEHAAGDVIVPVNSDHLFAHGWLTKLIERWHESIVLAPVMLEPGRGPKRVHFPNKNGTGSFLSECGDTLEKFDIDLFEQECDALSEPRLSRGGVYMPCMMLKQPVIDMGMFRPGNLASCVNGRRVRSTSFDNTGFPADLALFRKLKVAGIEHHTCWSSFCYHFMEGEMKE